MIAATGRRLRAAPRRLAKRVRGAPAGALALSAKLDRAANRLLQRARPPLARVGAAVRARGRRWGARAGRRLRPLGVLLLRGLSLLERLLLRAAARARRTATRASAVLTPQRAICLTILASAACLIVSQFVDYRAVEVGQPGYVGLPGGTASAPTVGAETAGQAHAYLLVPVALLAAALAVAVLRNGRRRGLGRVVFALGLLSLAVALLVDLPAGLDASAQATRFSGATAVLENGFYAQVAAAGWLMIGGLVLARRRGRHRYRLRKPSLARTQRGRRRERTV